MLACFCEEPMIWDSEDLNIFTTKCGHIFHKACLVQWLEQSETCPQCRSEVTESEIFRLYPALSDDNPNDELNTLLQSCLESLDETKSQLEQMTALCKEKDEIITNLKIDADKVKTFGQENEALKSLLQMLDGLKDMAAIICKTADKSPQQDAVTDSDIDNVVIEPRTDSPIADASVSEPRTESSDVGDVVIEQRTESVDVVMEPRTESVDDALVIEPRTESLDDGSVVIEPRAESLDDGCEVIEPRAESLDDDTDVIEPRTESLDDDTDVIEPRTESLDADNVIIEPRTESLDNVAVDYEPRMESVDADVMVTQSETEAAGIDAEVPQPGIDSPNADDAAMTRTRTESDDAVETASSMVHAETAAIKSSLNALGSMLIRITEIKNSKRENQ